MATGFGDERIPSVDVDWSGRVSRRRFLALTGVLGASVVGPSLLAACGGDSDDDDAPTSQSTSPAGSDAPTAASADTTMPAETGSDDDASPSSDGSVEGARPGGTFRYAGPLLVATFDPIYFDTPISLSYSWPAYNALVENSPVGNLDEIGPGLADEWEVSEDGLTYTFTLHPGIQFHDGEPFTSEDVKYTYDAIKSPPEGLISRRAATFDAIETIATPDELTVVITASYPSASFLPGIASIPILPKHIHEQGPFVDTAVGTGPFTFVSYQKDIELVLAKNPSYWRDGYPYLDEVRVLFMTDTAARLQAMRTGNIDQFSNIDDASERIFREDYADTIELVQYPRLNVGVILMNHQKPDAPWADPRVRRAISLGIDRQAYIDTVWGGRGDIIGMMPNVGGWALPAEELATYPGYGSDHDANLDQARALLEEAGYPDGFTVSTVASTGYLGDMALFSQAALAEIGITLELDIVDEPTVGDRRTSGEFDWLVNTIPTSVDDPDEQLSLFVTGKTLNFSRYSNPEIDAMYEEQLSIIDVDERRELVLDIQRRLLDDMPVIMLQGRVDVGAHASYVKDIAYHPSQHFHFSKALERVWLDKE